MKEPESVDPFLFAIRRRNRRIAIATVLVFVVPLGYVTHSFLRNGSRAFHNLEDRFFDPENYEHDLTAEQSQAVNAALDATRTRAAEARKSWRAALDAALSSGLTERPDLGRCPIHVADPGKSTEAYPSVPAWLTTARKPEDVNAVEPARWEKYDREIKTLAARATQQHTDRYAAQFVKDAQAFAAYESWTWDVLLIIDKRVEPKGLGAGEGYLSGEIDGRAYLYDYRAGAIVCAGRVHAENSDEVRYKYTTTIRLGVPDSNDGSAARESALKRDLDVETYRAAAAALGYRAGPPLPQEP